MLNVELENTVTKVIMGAPSEVAIAKIRAMRAASHGSLCDLAEGIVCCVAGQWRQSIQHLEAALDVLKGNPLAKAYLALAFFNLHGRFPEFYDPKVMCTLVSLKQLYPQSPTILRQTVKALEDSRLFTASAGNKATTEGRQTDSLEDEPIGCLQQLLEMLRAVVRRHFMALMDSSDDSDLPFTLNAWAVSLTSGGYQKPHIHFGGIFSGVLYLKVPKSSDRGNLLFPRTLSWLPDGRNEDDDPIVTVVPAEGHVVIFPSYLWHKTELFQSKGERVSLAFDVLPNLEGA